MAGDCGDIRTSGETKEDDKAVDIRAGDVLIDLNFDDNDTDECHTYSNGGQAVLGAENGELCLDITGTGSLDYANQIYYDGFELNQDCVYELSFDVHSTIERGIQYRLQINGGDYHAYVMDDITIGTETQHISNQFTMSEASDPAPRMCMNLGHFEGVGDDSVPHKVYFDNMERVNGDLSWFIDKFDYRYKNEPWKNSKDALPRGIIKIGHTFVE